MASLISSPAMTDAPALARAGTSERGAKPEAADDDRDHRFAAELADKRKRAQRTPTGAPPPPMQQAPQAKLAPQQGGDADAPPALTQSGRIQIVVAEPAAPSVAGGDGAVALDPQLFRAAAHPPADATPDATAQAAMQAEPTAPAAAQLAQAPASPLEQAIHELLRQYTANKGGAQPDATDLADLPRLRRGGMGTGAQPVLLADGTPRAAAAPPTATAHAVTGPAAVAEPRALPEQTNPSHVHLVLDDPHDEAARVVVTVAVRGNQVSTTLRASDDATAASLSRNAAALDDAMRGRGLSLAELDTGRDDPRHHQPHQQHQPQQHEDEDE